MGLNPGTSGSCPEPKADAQPLSHPGIPRFFYLFTHERQRHRQREKQAPCREPDVGLDPGTPGSRPGLKAGAKPWSHPGHPLLLTFKEDVYLSSSLGFPTH